MHAAVVKVPDPRLNHLGTLYPDRKRVYAEVEYVDFPYASLGQRDQSAEAAWIGSLRTVDALVAVVRAFDDRSDASQPVADYLTGPLANVADLQLGAGAGRPAPCGAPAGAAEKGVWQCDAR